MSNTLVSNTASRSHTSAAASAASTSRAVFSAILVAVLLLAVVGAHGWWLNTHYAEAYASPDAPGYFIPTKLLAQDGHAWITPGSPVQYVGPHFVETEDGGRYVSRLAPGLAWIAAPAYMFGGGYGAAMYVNPILASLTVLFLFLLCRRWMGGGFALLAALAYAVNPTANFQAIHADAHTGATAFLVIGLYFLDGWARWPGPWRALLAGLLLGVAPTIRPAVALCGIGIALLVLLKVWRDGPPWRQLFLLILGAAIPLGAWTVHDYLAFQTWLPGPDLTAVAAAVTWEGFATNAVSYLEDIGGRGTGMLLGLGLAGMIAMLFQRESRMLGIGLLGIVVPIAMLPMSRAFGWDALHYFIPTFPLFTLGTFWVLRQLALTTPRVGWPAALAVTALTITMGLPVAMDRLQRESRGHQLAAAVVKGAERIHLPQDSLVVCDPRLANALEYGGQWHLVDQGLITGGGRTGAVAVAAEAAARRDVPARSYREAYHRLSGAELQTQVLRDVFEWAKGRRVFWIGRSEDYQEFRAAVSTKGRLVKFAEIKMPALPERPSPRSGWSTIRRGGDSDNDSDSRASAWRIPDDGQPLMVYEWDPEQSGTDDKDDRGKEEIKEKRKEKKDG
ncbi:MAG: hypothetical protein ACYTKC_18715 [Planctomycetota bacterium]|jgi:hypothetical protein